MPANCSYIFLTCFYLVLGNALSSAYTEYSIHNVCHRSGKLYSSANSRQYSIDYTFQLLYTPFVVFVPALALNQGKNYSNDSRMIQLELCVVYSFRSKYSHDRGADHCGVRYIHSIGKIIPKVLSTFKLMTNLSPAGRSQGSGAYGHLAGGYHVCLRCGCGHSGHLLHHRHG